MLEMEPLRRPDVGHVIQDGHPSVEHDEEEHSTDEALKSLASGAAPHSAAQAVHRAVTRRSCLSLSALLGAGAATDVADNQGWSPLSQAVLSQWVEGVRLLLEAGADVTARTGLLTLPTVLHLAASLESAEILEALLQHPDIGQIVNEANCNGETPLFVLISNKKALDVTSLLRAGADVTVTMRGATVLHLAVKENKPCIIQALFQHDKPGMDGIKEEPWFKPPGLAGITALHLAAHAGNDGIVGELLRQKCDPGARMDFYECKAFTALHLAVHSNRVAVVRLLLECDSSLVDQGSADGWMPVHMACLFGFEECVQLLLLAGSDLSATITRTDGKLATCMNMLLFSVPFSVDFLYQTFDSCINCREIQNNKGGVKRYIDVDFTILLPKRIRHFQHLSVVDALLQTGNQLNQQRLFLHPLLESYLYLEWKAMSTFYYVILVAYILFALGFSIHVFGVFHLQDMFWYPSWLTGINRVLAVSILIILYYEGMLTTMAAFVMRKKCRYTQKFTFFKHLVIFCLSFLKFVWSFTLPVFVYLVPNNISYPHELATVSLLLCWFRIMFLISRIPSHGFYLLMFFEVTFNFFKVFLSFSGIIAVFVMAFILEFKPISPFNSTSNAIIKTFVMMSSEFDHSDLLNELNAETYTSALFKEFIFILFVMLVAIVITNILVAKAIKDVKEIDRVRKQAEFLSRLEKVIELSRACLAAFTRIKPLTLCQIVISRAKNEKVVISINENLKGGVKLPKKMRLEILEIAHKNKLNKG